MILPPCAHVWNLRGRAGERALGLCYAVGAWHAPPATLRQRKTNGETSNMASPLGGSCHRRRRMRGHLPDTSPSSGARARHLLPQGEGFFATDFPQPAKCAAAGKSDYVFVQNGWGKNKTVNPTWCNRQVGFTALQQKKYFVCTIGKNVMHLRTCLHNQSDNFRQRSYLPSEQSQENIQGQLQP